jgi:hypothetical protein
MFVFNATEGGYEKALHLVRGSGDSAMEVGGVIGDGKGLMMFRPSFDETAFVLRSGFVAVFIREVDFYAGEFVFISVQDAVKIGFDQVGEFFVHGDVLVAADLNLHSLNSLSLTCEVRRMELAGSGRVFEAVRLAGCAKLFE